jgi:hypothetical protein
MYDGPQYDYEECDELPPGLRLNGNGERRPSAILDAIRMDMQFVHDKAIEGGMDYDSVAEWLLVADAMLAYVKTSSHLDLSFPVNDEEEMDVLDGEYDAENLAIYRYVSGLLSDLDKETPAFMTYDWASNDPNDDAAYELGVWIDWAEINRHLEKGTMISVPHEADLDDIDFVAAAMEQGAAYALVDDGESRIGIYRLGEVCTQEWLRE